MIKVSVIIPTYKPQRYLWECLDSLKNQTFPKTDYEIIIVLNGCSDPYESQIDEYITDNLNSLNVNFIKTERAGVSNARNIALERAKGEYITFVDDDDYVSPYYLEGLYDKVGSDTISLSYPYAFIDGTNEQKTYSLTSVYNKRAHDGRQSYQCAKKYFAGPCMKMIPRDFIQGRKFDVNFTNGEDSLFMFLISDQFKYVDFAECTAIYYRRYRKNSAVTTSRSRYSKILNGLRLYGAYTKVYFRHPFQYNILYYIRCLLGILRGMFS